MTKARVLLLVLGVVTLLVAAWLLTARRQAEVIAIPEEPEVEEVTAVLYGCEGRVSAISEFALPHEYVSPVLAALRPAERSEYPRQWDTLCTFGLLRIRCRDGRLIEVTWPDSGKNPLCFQVNGKRCVRGGSYMPTRVVRTPEGEEGWWSAECYLLAGIVLEAHQEIVSGQKSSEARECFEKLEQSAGKRPPIREWK